MCQTSKLYKYSLIGKYSFMNIWYSAPTIPCKHFIEKAAVDNLPSPLSRISSPILSKKNQPTEVDWPPK